MHPAHARSGLIRVLAAPVDDDAHRFHCAPETCPRVLSEVGVVGDALHNERVSGLHEERSAASEEEGLLPVHTPSIRERTPRSGP